jgi:FixJ family two-component response regulator
MQRKASRSQLADFVTQGSGGGYGPLRVSRPCNAPYVRWSMPVPSSAVIYLVDDDAAVRDALRLVLETHDHAVRAFESPSEALGKIENSAPACLVVDYHMPAMNGLELLAALRARDVTMPAILITGLCDAKVARRAKAAGVAGVIEKPFADAALLALVTSALTGSADPDFG